MEYKYKGINRSGKYIMGIKRAVDSVELLNQLEKEEITCISYSQQRYGLCFRRIRMKAKALYIFARNMKNSMKSGMPVIMALDGCIKQNKNKYIKKALNMIHICEES